MAPLWLRLSCILGALMACTALAAPDDPVTVADEKAIRTTVDKLVAALNARNVKDAAALFTPTGEFVDGDGNTFHGREAIQAEFEALFKANAHTKVVLEMDSVRFLSTGVFIEEGTVTLNRNPNIPGKKIGYLIVHAQQKDGSWLLASVRSKGEDEATPQEELQDLGWMIGEWVDESADSVVKTKVRWSDDKNFILSDFTVQVAGKPAVTGSHRIGYDPRTGSFKSWVFDSAGGHAEGFWTLTNDRWVVKFTGVRPSGEAGSMTAIYQPLGPDSYLYTVTDRVMGDEVQPDVSVKVVRKPPEPAKAANN
jgi:uncharacterized protein (TIGR02246 family)